MCIIGLDYLQKYANFFLGYHSKFWWGEGGVREEKWGNAPPSTSTGCCPEPYCEEVFVSTECIILNMYIYLEKLFEKIFTKCNMKNIIISNTTSSDARKNLTFHFVHHNIMKWPWLSYWLVGCLHKWKYNSTSHSILQGQVYQNPNRQACRFSHNYNSYYSFHYCQFSMVYWFMYTTENLLGKMYTEQISQYLKLLHFIIHVLL